MKPILSTAQKYALDKIRFHYFTNTDEQVPSPILRLKKVNVKYKSLPIIRDLNWTVKTGEKWCVLGDNGSGKSTLIGLIYGDHPQAFSNAVYLFGHRRGKGESMWDLKKRMGFVSPELHAYFPLDLSVRETILSGFSDALYARRATERQEAIVNNFLIYFDQLELLPKPWSLLSTGEQRLILFIRALVKAPPVLLLDEPFQGLDWDTVELAKKLLNEILTERHTLLFISHFRDEIPLIVTKELRLQKPHV